MRPTTPLQKTFRKLRLTTKDVNRGYYKGNRSGSMGRHTAYGGYIIEYEKVRTYMVPDLTDFKLTPFVTEKIKPKKGSFGVPGGPRNTQRYLDEWKATNGLD